MFQFEHLQVPSLPDAYIELRNNTPASIKHGLSTVSQSQTITYGERSYFFSSAPLQKYKATDALLTHSIQASM